MKNENILVTGADGFIGSHLCERLVKDGANIKALVAYNSFGTIGWLNDLHIKYKDNIEIISGDIRDNNFIISITKDIDIIYHLAALIAIPYSYAAARSFIDTNTINGTTATAALCPNVVQIRVEASVMYVEIMETQNDFRGNQALQYGV